MAGALVVLLRGVNVGGHRTFKPSQLVKTLARFDVVNIGAAGTFVARKAGSEAKLRAAIAKALPFVTNIMICKGADIARLVKRDPFKGAKPDAKIMQFVSLLAKKPPKLRVPFQMPPSGRWGVRIIAIDGRFVMGMYRREMKAIGWLGKLDDVFGVPATTRNWNTINAIAKLLDT